MDTVRISTSNTTDSGNADVVEQLSSFCRGEISAVETYQKALAEESMRPFKTTLQNCCDSHQARVELLSTMIRDHGGAVPTSSGIWGALASLAEEVAEIINPKTVIKVLEEGEDHGVADYQRDLPKLDAATQQMLKRDVLAKQMQTHQAMSELKRSLEG